MTETDITWKKLPPQLGFGSGITCRHRLRAWQEARVWQKLHHAVLQELSQEDVLG